MKTISLTQGLEAIVDDEDFDRINAFKWCASYGYAVRKYKGSSVRMHHIVLNYEPKFNSGIDTDHINGNGLDNRKSNLRLVSRRVNMLNTERSRNARVIEQRGNVFLVRPFINGVRTYLGCFKTEKEALEVLRRSRDVI